MQSDFNSNNRIEPSLSNQGSAESSFWQVPPINFLKANFDAAVDSINYKETFAVVIRNRWGMIVD